MQYGTFYALSDFVDRLVPKSALVDTTFIKAVMDGLKRISVVQNDNPWVTLSATVTAGVWIYYRNKRHFLLNPTQQYIRLETAYGLPADAVDIEAALVTGIENGEVIRTDKKGFKQWRVTARGLHLIWEFLESLDRPSDADAVQVDSGSHPRYFPSEARVMALNAFERDGRECPGVEGLSSKHKIPEGAQIEFDHILPYSKGGPSTYRNIQILCTACNRLKGATAA